MSEQGYAFSHCTRPHNYVVAARASAVVLAAEGHLTEATQLRDNAAELETYIAHHQSEDEDLDHLLAKVSHSKGDKHE